MTSVPSEGDERYMRRCIQLALLGQGHVAPNPMVGAVLVYRDRVIGEGYHQRYGQSHAEVNCIASVKEEDRRFIHQSTIYVSLEPCAHFGKTPPCADLLIRHKISRVVVGCRDPFNEVNGKGIAKLQAAGIPVTAGVLEAECRELNKRFFTFHERRRPWILLKWAQTADHFVGSLPGEERLMISSAVSNRLVHQWRSQEAAILVGSGTAVLDDPALSNRLWSGPSPVRVLIDRRSKVPSTHRILDGSVPTIVYNHRHSGKRGNLEFRFVDPAADLLPEVLTDLHARGLLSVLVEGGPTLQRHFIDAGLWDQARVITNRQLFTGTGVPAPVLRHASAEHSQVYGEPDLVQTFTNQP